MKIYRKLSQLCLFFAVAFGTTNLEAGNALFNSLLSSIPCKLCQKQTTLMFDIVDQLNGRPLKELKAQLLIVCMTFRWRTIGICRNYVETYPELLLKELTTGWLGSQFFCQSFMNTCRTAQDLADNGYTSVYKMVSLQDYFLQFDYEYSGVIDAIYQDEMVEQQDTFTILYLNNLYIDPLYVPGSSSKCEGIVCCHAEQNDQVPQEIDIENLAGKFGHSGCDMPLHGVKQILQALKIQLGYNPSIIIVSGVVSMQQGQLTLKQHLDTIKQAYQMIEEVFRNSLIVPVLGPSDYYPQQYTPFSYNISDEIELSPLTYQNKQQIQIDSQQFLSEVTQLINQNYLSFGTQMSAQGDYFMSAVPIYDDIFKTLIYPDGLTIYVINMQACNSANMALFKTFNDPGDQLARLQQALEETRLEGNLMVLVGAGRAPGEVFCNRQWSNRLLALVDEYQDVLRLTMFGSEKDSFQIFNGVETVSPVNVAQISGQFSSRERYSTFRIYTVDRNTYMPTNVDVYQIKGVDSAQTTADLEIGAIQRYPNLVEMANLSPSEYKNYSKRLRALEEQSVNFKNLNDFNDGNVFLDFFSGKNRCNDACRKQLTCQLLYSVNEQVIECCELDIDIVFLVKYFVGVYQNPWFTLD